MCLLKEIFLKKIRDWNSTDIDVSFLSKGRNKKQDKDKEEMKRNQI